MGKGKKSPMKTAKDVIDRLKWDEDLPAKQFMIGYLDRFDGIVEKPFDQFSWEDLASVDHLVLAIPQHRIQYFKYRDTIVWDKRNRFDRIFQSCEEFDMDIYQFLKFVDDEAEKAVLAAVLEELNEENIDDPESDSDDDIQIVSASSAQVPVVNTDVTERLRSTHFLAIKIKDRSTVDNAYKFQQHLVQQDPSLLDCALPSSLFHVTLCMLNLRGIDGIISAKEALSNIEKDLINLMNSSDFGNLRISGVGNFGHRVVYAKVHCDDELTKLRKLISGALSSCGDEVNVSCSFDFVPHMTMFKVSRLSARRRHSQFILKHDYDTLSDMSFGEQKIDNLSICVLGDGRNGDSYYKTVYDLDANCHLGL